MAKKANTAAGNIVHNSFWYGIETVVETVVFLGTSVAVGRYLGPTKLGYFAYINYFVAFVTNFGGSGLAGATRKYMSEFLGLGRPGTARAIYHLASRYQLLGACLLSGTGVAGILLFGDHDYRLMSCILIVSLVPGVMSWVPAQANQALQDVSYNTYSAFGYILSYAAVIALTVHFQWGLVGVASAQLIGRTFEVVLRTVHLNKRLRRIPMDALDDTMIARIRRFCLQAMGIQVLTAMVWGRMEMNFLKHFCRIEELAFYSVSTTFVGNLFLIPRTFGGATGITLMVESVRDPKSVDNIVKNAYRFLLLVVLPVHLGAVAICSQALSFAYGAKYMPAVPVMIVATLLAMPKAFQEISDVLMRAADRQNQILIWLGITSVLNVALDWYLIKHYGAVGAAWANGLAQAFAVFAIWYQARRVFVFGFPFATAVRLLAASSVMAVLAYFIVRSVPGLPGLVAAVLAATVTYVLLIKWLHALLPSDRVRLGRIGEFMPQSFRQAYLSVIRFVTPEEEVKTSAIV